MSETLHKITELARDARDKAGQLLASAQASRLELESHLALLHDYRQEYNSRLQEAMMAGISSSLLNDYRLFLASLDRTLAQAKEQLKVQEQQLDQCREQWQGEQKRLTSFDTLLSRQAQRAQRAQQRNELRTNDEINNNKVARRYMTGTQD